MSDKKPTPVDIEAMLLARWDREHQGMKLKDRLHLLSKEQRQAMLSRKRDLSSPPPQRSVVAVALRRLPWR